MAEAGFDGISVERCERSYELRESGPYRERTHSSLHLIPPEAFARGLALLERDLRAGPIRGVSPVLLVWATKR